MTVMLLLALVVGTMSWEDTVSPSGDTMNGVYCNPFDEPFVCAATVHRRDFPFPEQLNRKFDPLFSNVV